MSRIPQNFIDDLLSRLDIVDIVDRRVKLKKAGKNYSACCPFHDEKTPSFTVSPDKQFYYCFGCGANGNAIGFVMEYERLGFVETIESLAQHAGLEVPKENTKQNQVQDSRRKELYEQLNKASLYYQNQLKEHPQRLNAVNYLKGRGLTGVIARDYNLGYAPPGWDNLLLKLGQNEHDISLLIDSGLLVHKPEERKTYDRFRHRIIFPIRDTRGRVIGFGGRVLGDDKPKYLNSPETEVFSKGRELYGLYEARQSSRQLDSLIVVEGYMDVIALGQYGIQNAVATLGTACGEEHLTLAFKYVDEIVFCFDGDNAGRNAAKRALMNSLTSMQDGRQIRFLFLPEGQDPDTLVRQVGSDRFNDMIKNAIPLEDFLFEVASENININSMDGRAKFSKVASPLIGKIPEGVYRELMFNNLAKRTGLSNEVLKELQNQKAELPNMVEESTAQGSPTPALTQEPPFPDIVEKNSPDYGNTYTPNYPAQLEPKTAITLNPIRIATILLLDKPELLTKINVDGSELEDDGNSELSRLIAILKYIKKRPQSNFNHIMGFWAGAHGVEAQQELAKLVSNQCFGSAKSIKNYNPSQELEAALSSLTRKQILKKSQDELNQLKALPPEQRTQEDSKRLVELVSLVYQQKKQLNTPKI